MNWKAFSLLIIPVLCFFRSHAQYSDSIHYRVNVASTGNINKTNDNDVYLLNNALKFGVRKKSIVLNANGTWVYGATNHTLTNNDLTSSLDFNLYKTFRHFYYWGLGNYTTSYSLKINNQAQAGLGIACSIIDTSYAYLNLSEGILYENNDLQLDTGRSLYSTFRNSFRLSFSFTIWKRLVISNTSFYQNSFKDRSDYIIKSDTKLGIKIKQWLSVTASFSYNKFSRTDKENLLLTYGLVFDKFY